MGKNPAFLFYPGDWIRDPQLQMATHQTKGIWIDCLCRMWDAPERGIITGKVDQVRKLIGCSKEEFDQFIAENTDLQFADILLHVTEGHKNVTLTNRRMYKEQKDRESNRIRQGKYRKNKSNTTCNEKVTPHTSVSVTDSVSVTKKKDKRLFVPTAVETRIASCLRKKILDNNPKAKVNGEMKWCKVVRLMMSVDKRTEKEILDLIEFSQNDEFWRTNILSMDKLRKQFDQLTLKMGGSEDDRWNF